MDKPQYILLLILSVIVNFLFGKSIEKSDKPKFLLTIGIAYNLLWLCVFKYADFIFENINFISEKLGGDGQLLNPWNLLLPLGISFYTFQSISYLIDVYRRDVKAETSFCRFWSIPDHVPQTDHGTYSPV